MTNFAQDRPRSVLDEKVAELIHRTLKSTPEGMTHWSTRTMAGEIGVSHMTVCRVWQTFGLKPHRSDTFKLSTDPFFVEKVRSWLARRPRYHLHFTPTYSSWLNQVETWFGIITRKAIRRGSFRSTKELAEKIDLFVKNYNRNSKPFIWTATAESIFEKIGRLCQSISVTGH